MITDRQGYPLHVLTLSLVDKIQLFTDSLEKLAEWPSEMQYCLAECPQA